jgi:hypothetical protein
VRPTTYFLSDRLMTTYLARKTTLGKRQEDDLPYGNNLKYSVSERQMTSETDRETDDALHGENNDIAYWGWEG